jgi:hypothetical protein
MAKDSDPGFINALEKWVDAHKDELTADVIKLVNIRSVK